MPVREKGRRSPGSQPARPFSGPEPPEECRQSAGLFALDSGFTAETDCLLEETGFEPSVPHDTIKGSEAPHVIAGAGTLFSDQLNAHQVPRATHHDRVRPLLYDFSEHGLDLGRGRLLEQRIDQRKVHG